MPDRRHLRTRFARYTIGSAVAVVTSEVAFVACYGSGLLATTASSVVAFVAGAVPNYVLNRSWAFGRRGRVRVGREVVLYVLVSLVGLAAAALATGWAGRLAPHVASARWQRTAVVAAAYLATYGALFLLKFAVYQLVIFAAPATTSPGSPGRTGRRT